MTVLKLNYNNSEWKKLRQQIKHKKVKITKQ